MAKGIAAAGNYDVDLLISSRKRFALRIEKDTRDEHLTIYHLPRIQINSFLTGRILRAFIALGFILTRRYDLIHFFTVVQFETLIPFIFLRLFMPWRKHIMDWDDYWTSTHTCLQLYERFPFSLIRHYYRFAEYHVQRLAIHGTTTSTFLANEFQTIGVKHVRKIINGVDHCSFAPIRRQEARRRLGIRNDVKMFLSVGNTFFRSRTVDLVLFFQTMYRMDPDISLYVTKDLRMCMQKYGPEEVVEAGVWEHIHDTGYLAGEELALFLGACDAVIFMMASTPTEIACFPIRISTYLNGERFIVMKDVPTEACNVLKGLGCAVIDSSMEHLAARTLDVISNPAKQRELEERARVAKQELSWDVLNIQLLEFYDEVLR